MEPPGGSCSVDELESGTRAGSEAKKGYWVCATDGVCDDVFQAGIVVESGYEDMVEFGETGAAPAGQGKALFGPVPESVTEDGKHQVGADNLWTEV